MKVRGYLKGWIETSTTTTRPVLRSLSLLAPSILLDVQIPYSHSYNMYISEYIPGKQKRRKENNKKETEDQTPNSTLSGTPVIKTFCCFPLTHQCNVLFAFSRLRKSSSISQTSPSFTDSFW